jgi:hypothetical protein
MPLTSDHGRIRISENWNPWPRNGSFSFAKWSKYRGLIPGQISGMRQGFPLVIGEKNLYSLCVMISCVFTEYQHTGFKQLRSVFTYFWAWFLTKNVSIIFPIHMPVLLQNGIKSARSSFLQYCADSDETFGKFCCDLMLSHHTLFRNNT